MCAACHPMCAQPAALCLPGEHGQGGGRQAEGAQEVAQEAQLDAAACARARGLVAGRAQLLRVHRRRLALPGAGGVAGDARRRRLRRALGAAVAAAVRRRLRAQRVRRRQRRGGRRAAHAALLLAARGHLPVRGAPHHGARRRLGRRRDRRGARGAHPPHGRARPRPDGRPLVDGRPWLEVVPLLRQPGDAAADLRRALPHSGRTGRRAAARGARLPVQPQRALLRRAGGDGRHALLPHVRHRRDRRLLRADAAARAGRVRRRRRRHRRRW